MIGNMLAKLAGHSMFAEPGSLDRLKMCADCRVIDMMQKDLSVAELPAGERHAGAVVAMTHPDCAAGAETAARNGIDARSCLPEARARGPGARRFLRAAGAAVTPQRAGRRAARRSPGPTSSHGRRRQRRRRSRGGAGTVVADAGRGQRGDGRRSGRRRVPDDLFVGVGQSEVSLHGVGIRQRRRGRPPLVAGARLARAVWDWRASRA